MHGEEMKKRNRWKMACDASALGIKVSSEK
jgi:hypothetical protein